MIDLSPLQNVPTHWYIKDEEAWILVAFQASKLLVEITCLKFKTSFPSLEQLGTETKIVISNMIGN
jgi:hypothetical protein